MGEIRVTFGALEAARADVAGTAARIGGRLDDLRRAVTPLAASWDGRAAEEYREWQRRWDGSAGNLAGVLGQIARALADAEAGYRATENANAALWRP